MSVLNRGQLAVVFDAAGCSTAAAATRDESNSVEWGPVTKASRVGSLLRARLELTQSRGAALGSLSDVVEALVNQPDAEVVAAHVRAARQYFSAYIVLGPQVTCAGVVRFGLGEDGAWSLTR